MVFYYNKKGVIFPINYPRSIRYACGNDFRLHKHNQFQMNYRLNVNNGKINLVEDQYPHALKQTEIFSTTHKKSLMIKDKNQMN